MIIILDKFVNHEIIIYIYIYMCDNSITLRVLIHVEQNYK